MFEERMNSKGQEISITFMILLVVGIIVAVIVILGFTTGFDFIFGNIGRLPGQSLQATIKSCEIAAQNDLKADYCLEYKEVEISGVEQFVNCDFTAIKNNLEETITCDSTDNNAKDFCVGGKIKVSNFDKTLINGETCQQRLGLDSIQCGAGGSVTLGTQWSYEPKVSCGAGEIDITSYVKKDTTPSGSKCCMKNAATTS